ncbi:unnamed protein product [Sphagnum troendelagicum]
MQRFIDGVLGVVKESLKTLSQESFNSTVRFINGFSALVLALLPAKASLEGIQGWELHPTFRAPRLPQWMEEGVSSFNQFIHESDSDSESETESEYESGLDDNNSLPPSSPASQTSHFSRASSVHSQHERRHSSSFWKRVLRKLTCPFHACRGTGGHSQVTPRARNSSGRRGSHELNSSSGSLSRMYSIATRHFSGVKDFMMPKQTGDLRRGIVEDLQLSVELFIERVFDIVRNLIYFGLSPFETMKLFFRWCFVCNPYDDSQLEIVDTATLGNADPTPQKQIKREQTLNTDSRTCEDVIIGLGYPYEALRVTTADGHVLLLERIPRQNSRKVLYLQHGLLDSSLGWVSSGVVGSQAFAAYDQGYDVFLGNFRGLASREHVNKHISAQRYWQYSVNEHGTQDIPAMLTRIHQIKMYDLRDVQDELSPSNPVNCDREELPYSLCGVAHSLGGASILMYVVTRCLENRPHYLSRLVLLSPAGFHQDAPAFCALMQYAIPFMAPIIGPLIPGLYIPTRFFRGVFNKLARDFQNYPAIGGLVQTLLSWAVGGDSSNWVGAIGMSHYNMDDMPGVSFRVAHHLAQMMRVKRFIMFDFGSVLANIEAYGMPEPLDIGANYGVIDIPVDLVAGLKDRLIPCSMVRKHYRTLRNAGCKVSYNEFEYAHLDFTFGNREELLAYVMSRLFLVMPPKLQNGDLQKPRSLKRLESKSMKKSKRSFKEKLKIEVNSESEDGEVLNGVCQNGFSTLLQNGIQSDSQNGFPNGFHSGLEDMELDPSNDSLPLKLTSISNSDGMHTNDQELCNTESEVADRADAQEMKSDFEPQSFDDSSFFAFPSQEVASVMSRRASQGSKGTTAISVHKDYEASHDSNTNSPAEVTRGHGKLQQMTTNNTSKSNSFHKLKTRLFGSRAISGKQ